MPLHVFVPGESAQVAENLDANFSFLLNLIQTQGTGGSNASATGTSGATALGRENFSGIGTAFASAFAQATPSTATQSLATGAATGVADGTVVGAGQARSPATATGTSAAVAFENAGTAAVATTTGTSSVSYVGSYTQQIVATATGTSTAASTGTLQKRVVGTASGIATGNAVGQGSAAESQPGSTNTSPTGTPIFASTTPGTASANLNSFSLTASPGIVVFNGSNDTTVANAMELYYTNHTLYVQNSNGNWFSWASANTWPSAANPIPVVITESVEGLSDTTTTATIYASSTPGTAAPSGASIANGQLIAFSLTAVPGQIIRGGAIDTTTSNVTQLYYHNHAVWQVNTQLNWFSWVGPGNVWSAGTTASPIPATPALNVAIIPAISTATTFVASGTYQAFAGAGNPTLQYADNYQAGGTSTIWSTTDKSASITLSNANQTASSTVNALSQSVRSSTSYSTGKKIFEVTAGTITNNWEVGLADSTFNLATGLGDDTHGFGFQPNFPSGSQAFVSNATVISSIAGHNSVNGEKVTACCDFDAKKIWITSSAMRTAGFPWNNDVIGNQNPATGTGGFSFSFSGGAFICFNEFDAPAAGTLNTLGPYAVAIPAGFTSWDVSSSSTWQAFPSTINVTPTTWSFVHPPITVQNAAQNLAVRDANNTGIVGVSQPFAVATPGVITLNPMSIDDSTVGAGLPAGSLVGNVTIPASGGTFTGTVSSNNANFQVTGTGGFRQLVTTAVLGTNAGIAIILTASMSGAVNSGETLNVTVVVTAESNSATSVTTIGPQIVGSSTNGVAGSQLTWALVAGSGNQISLNGITQTITANVQQLYYINHTLYQAFGTTTTSWNFYNGSAIVNNQTTAGNWTSSASPIPVIVLSGQTFPPGTNGPTGITASLTSNNTAMTGVTWTEDSASFNFSGNALVTVGTLPQGSYPIHITATIA